MSETTITQKRYNDELTDLAELIEQEVQEENAEYPSDLIWETVDTHEWIIHTNKAIQLLQVGNSEPVDWKHCIEDSDSWQDVIAVMAYRVMENDLRREIYQRDNIEL